MKTKNKRSITRTILHYFGEVIVVIIGIFIAFQLNNLKESNKSAEEEQKSLKRMASDLLIEEYVLKNYKKQFKKSAKYLKDIVYYDKRENLDSIVFHLAQIFVRYKMNSEYVSLKYSGRLSQISNDSLRHKIVSYYEGIYTVLDELSKNHKDYNSKYIENYLLTKFPSDTAFIVDPSIVEKRLGDQVFRNILIDQLAIYKNISNNLYIHEVEALRKAIQKEINWEPFEK
jgi:hypothetical protein